MILHHLLKFLFVKIKKFKFALNRLEQKLKVNSRLTKQFVNMFSLSMSERQELL